MNSRFTTEDLKQVMVQHANALIRSGAINTIQSSQINAFFNEEMWAEHESSHNMGLWNARVSFLISKLIELVTLVLPVKLADTLLSNILNELVQKQVIKNDSGYTSNLAFAIYYKFTKLAHIYLDNYLCDFTNDLPNQRTCLLDILHKSKFNEEIAIKLIEQDNVNYKVGVLGGNIITYACFYKNKIALLRLLKSPKLVLSDNDITFIIEMNDEAIARALIENIQQINLTKALLNTLLPVAMMSDDQQGKIYEFVMFTISNNEYLQNNSDFKRKLVDFLDSKKPLPYKYMNRLSIVHNLLIYLNAPERIDQYSKNLCGVVALMQHGIMANPAALIGNVLDICETETSFKFGRFSVYVAQLWQEVIRDRYNTVLGYKSDSYFAGLTALTRPDQLYQMYHDFGFHISSETCQIRVNPNSGVNRLIAPFWNKFSHPDAASTSKLKIYSSQHANLQHPSDRFNHLCEAVTDNSYITILVPIEFMNIHLLQSTESVSPLLGLIEPTHYMVMLNFKYDKNEETVSFDFMSYGKMCKVVNLQRSIFEEGFLGALAMTTKVNMAYRMK